MNMEVLARIAEAKRGRTAQLDMVVEECAELIDAIQKYKRGRVKIDALIEEGVDVGLMVDQLRIMLGDNALWESLRRGKLERLTTLLEVEK